MARYKAQVKLFPIFRFSGFSPKIAKFDDGPTGGYRESNNTKDYSNLPNP